MLLLLLACPDPEPLDSSDSTRLAVCGDAVLEGGEACDDGNPWGGDGCLADCSVEAGPFEVEPNDLEPNPLDGSVAGSLPSGDVDCFRVEIEENEYVTADTVECADTQLDLFDPDGGLLARGTPGEEGGCSPIDPLREPGARFMRAGTWTVCLSGYEEVPAYRLALQVGDSCTLDIPRAEHEDPDGDGLIALCDDDDDGDGVLDVEDNCPETPNGPDAEARTPNTGGFLGTWLAVGPIQDPTPGECIPTTEVAPVPIVGDSVGELPWVFYLEAADRLDFLPRWATVGAPREVVLSTWVYSEDERTVTLAMGPDDGMYAWLDGVEVLKTSKCQGTGVDRYSAEVTLAAGWSHLATAVYDQGGGWGLYARFLDGDGAPVTDLELSPVGPESWVPDQTDTDGDGLGDACDPEP